jgi:hypothetical protein
MMDTSRKRSGDFAIRGRAMFKRFSRNRYGYTRWDGTQRIEGLDADDILNALADDYVEDGNLQQALRRLMQEGIRTDDGRRTMGLRELIERMRNQRQQQLNRYNMASGVMDDLRKRLEEIKQLERAGIQRRLDEANKLHDQPGQSDASQLRAQSDTETESEQGSQPSQPDFSSLSEEQRERLRHLREKRLQQLREEREHQQEQASAEGEREGFQQEQPGQPGQSSQPVGQPDQSSQAGQSSLGEAGSGDELTPEQRRRMLEMIARRKQDFLDQLPRDVPGQIKQLTDYDFIDD